MTSTPSRFPPLAPWAVLALTALLAAWTAQLYFSSRAENGVLREEVRLADLDGQLLRNAREEDRLVGSRTIAVLKTALKQAADPARLRLWVLAGPVPGPSSPVAAVAWNPVADKGIFTAADLPAAPPGQEYRLWFLPAGGESSAESRAARRGRPASTRLALSDSAADTMRMSIFAAVGLAPHARLGVTLEHSREAARPTMPFVLLSR
ncbi:MAG: anti-sigma factor [Opitutaceae bacterium]